MSSLISLDSSLAFFGVAILLGLSPGPDNLFVLMQSASRGRRAGFAVVLGLCTGLLGHTAAVALGLAAVFAASDTAFTVVKLGGAAYLAYLAWQAWRAPASTTLGAQATHVPLPRMYGRGVVMNLTNPKVLIFFLAFLPQFVKPELGAVGWQTLWFGFLFMLATLLVFGAIAWFAAALGVQLQRSQRAQHWLNRATAVVFLGLAARLALSQR